MILPVVGWVLQEADSEVEMNVQDIYRGVLCESMCEGRGRRKQDWAGGGAERWRGLGGDLSRLQGKS